MVNISIYPAKKRFKAGPFVKWITRALWLIMASLSVAEASACQSNVLARVANSYLTPFGLVSSDTGNIQYGGFANCDGLGGFFEVVQRFNGGRDNSIYALFYNQKINQEFSVRFALDRLDVATPDFAVQRGRVRVVYQGPVRVYAEYYHFMNSQDQRLLRWSVGKRFALLDEGAIETVLGGSFTTGFNLQDMYYADLGYSQRLSDKWSYRLQYNYQLQPFHNNMLTLGLTYRL